MKEELFTAYETTANIMTFYVAPTSDAKERFINICHGECLWVGFEKQKLTLDSSYMTVDE